MTTITEVGSSLQKLLGEEANRLGRETGFIERERVLNGSSFAQAMVFGWMSKPDSTLSELSQTAAVVGTPISKQGLDARFGPKAASFLRALLDRAVQQVVEGEASGQTLLAHFSSVHIIDSTTIQLPDELVSQWQGCGGSQTSNAALKISVDWDLRQGGLHGLRLSAGRMHDQRSPLAAGDYEAGSLRLADVGYFKLESLRTMTERGVYWVSRLKSSVHLYTLDGQRLDWQTLLRQTDQDAFEMPVLVGAARLPARCCVRRLDPHAVARRQAQLHERERKQQKPVSAATRLLALWAVCITNIPPSLLTLDEVMVLVRWRWQIELLFKLWKSVARLDQWRTANPWRILCELYAKLLAAVVQHWLLLVGSWFLPNRSLHLAFRLIQKFAWSLAIALFLPVFLAHVLNLLVQALATCTMSSLRQHPHTCQLLPPHPLS